MRILLVLLEQNKNQGQKLNLVLSMDKYFVY